MKPLYKGVFNWYGETCTLYAHAHSEKQAFYLFCRSLAQKYNTSSYACGYYFAGTNRYTITEEEKPMEIKIDIENQIKPLMKKMIADGINDYMDTHVYSSKAPRQGERWTEEDDKSLQDSLSDFLSRYAAYKGRSYGSICARVRRYFDDNMF